MSVLKDAVCYEYNKNWYLVVLKLNISPSQIDWGSIVVPNPNQKPSDWQCPYMEQYLNETETKKLCETYDLPNTDTAPCTVAFFLFRHGESVLQTPYGSIPLISSGKTPWRLKRILDFEKPD